MNMLAHVHTHIHMHNHTHIKKWLQRKGEVRKEMINIVRKAGALISCPRSLCGSGVRTREWGFHSGLHAAQSPVASSELREGKKKGKKWGRGHRRENRKRIWDEIRIEGGMSK